MPWLAGRSDETAVMAESGLHTLDHAVQLFWIMLCNFSSTWNWMTTSCYEVYDGWLGECSADPGRMLSA